MFELEAEMEKDIFLGINAVRRPLASVSKLLWLQVFRLLQVKIRRIWAMGFCMLSL